MALRKRIWEDYAADEGIDNNGQGGGLDMSDQWLVPIANDHQMNIDMSWQLEPRVEDFQWLDFVPDDFGISEQDVCYGCVTHLHRSCAPIDADNNSLYTDN